MTKAMITVLALTLMTACGTSKLERAAAHAEWMAAQP